MTPEDQQRILKRQRAAVTGKIIPERQRADRLNRTIGMLVDYESRFCAAMAEDFGVRSHDQSRLYDIVASIETLKHARKHVGRWMRPEHRSVDPLLRIFGASARIEYQPKGVVGVLSPWNFPLYLTFCPLAGIFAAGNAVMIKPSEHTPATSAVMQEAFARHFGEEEAAVITGDASVAAAFSALPLDHIIFTGSTSVGRHVMRAAADNLTPLTLELGGKSPVIVGTDPNYRLMADRIVTGKLLNAGQICLAPDYLLVPAQDEERIVNDLVASVESLYPDLGRNPDYAAVLGVRNRQRLARYVEEAREVGARIVDVGTTAADGRLPFTIIRDCPPALSVMQEEIFGPVLPILPYHSLDDAISFVNERPRPLGLYFFGHNPAEQRRVLDETVSGGVTVNDVIFHVTVEDLPFGGVGESGFGVYHGFDGFKTFSHGKPIFQQSRLDVAGLAGLRPPYGKKLRSFIRKHLSA
jgi:coniferyl-aldehyde dehydrogenase